MINVTKTYLPSMEKYKKYLEKIYTNGQITNNGILVQELEAKLKEYLKVKNIILVANGTMALEIAYKALGVNNFAVTTPFSFVATTSSMVFSQINPVFADINPSTLNIDHKTIGNKIIKGTSAIVPVHIFGNACEIENIEKIAKKNNLKLIFDGSHCFGIKYKNKNILSYGDITTISFHATKIFHTIEGGAIVTNNSKLDKKIREMVNFGLNEYYEIKNIGINAKMNEFEAAMGLCMLEEIDNIIKKRSEIWYRYEKELKNFVVFQKRNPNSTNNYSYFPIILQNEQQLLKTIKTLNKEKIYPRRYFYPSLDTLNYIKYKQYCPVSREISKKILCLPLYSELKADRQQKIISIIQDITNQKTGKP